MSDQKSSAPAELTLEELKQYHSDSQYAVRVYLQRLQDREVELVRKEATILKQIDTISDLQKECSETLGKLQDAEERAMLLENENKNLRGKSDEIPKNIHPIPIGLNVDRVPNTATAR